MKKILASVISGALFIGEIFLLKRYDVQAIGPAGTEVGFSHINAKVHELTGVNMLWYDITDYFGYFAIVVCAFFGLVGLIQLIRRKSLLKVDKEILALGVLYAVVIGFYVLFEKIIINYRPVIMPGENAPEASFPSSHTVLIVTVMISLMIITDRYVRSGGLAVLLKTACVLVTLITVGGRLYSGVHWFTDIVGGLLLTAALLFLFSAAVTDKNTVAGGYQARH